MHFLSAFDLQSSIITICLWTTIILVGSILLKKFNQPYIIAYLIAGVVMGPHGWSILADQEFIHILGELGIILLFFFIGMEISIEVLVENWKIAILGSLAQLVLSVGIIYSFTYFMDWSFGRAVVIGFVIALSSSAVIIKQLEEMNLLEKQLGHNVLNILIAQDIIVGPMLIVIAILGDNGNQGAVGLWWQVAGTVFLTVAFWAIYKAKKLILPFITDSKSDQELKIFVAILICSLGALIMAGFGVSPALGALLAGLYLHKADESEWVQHTLHSFRVVFVAGFFLSIGLMVNLTFIQENIWLVLALIIACYLINHGINTLILKFESSTWKEAIFGGALLAQIGELSFLISFSARDHDIITPFGFDLSVAIISISLVLSPIYVSGIGHLIKWKG